jgi:hypothetical protein
VPDVTDLKSKTLSKRTFKNSFLRPLLFPSITMAFPLIHEQGFERLTAPQAAPRHVIKS